MKQHPVVNELTPEPLDPDQVIAGQPEVSELTLLETGESGTSGLWQLTPGTVTDVEVEESFLVLRGRGTLEFDDGRTVALAPGVIHQFAGGEETTWTIEETLLKAYWIA